MPATRCVGMHASADPHQRGARSCPPLAVDRVRFVGDIIAAVIAESQSQAADAAEQIIIDYDPLPANADIEAALEEGTDILWEGAESNVCFAIGKLIGDVLARKYIYIYHIYI